MVKNGQGTEGPEMDQKAGNELHNMVQVFRFENQTASSSGGGGETGRDQRQSTLHLRKQMFQERYSRGQNLHL